MLFGVLFVHVSFSDFGCCSRQAELFGSKMGTKAQRKDKV
jgi:hypothetical protein